MGQQNKRKIVKHNRKAEEEVSRSQCAVGNTVAGAATPLKCLHVPDTLLLFFVALSLWLRLILISRPFSRESCQVQLCMEDCIKTEAHNVFLFEIGLGLLSRSFLATKMNSSFLLSSSQTSIFNRYNHYL